MSKNYLKVDVVSPLGSVFTGEADMVSLRGSAGEMGIAYGHTELLSTMPAGVVSIKKDEITEVLYVSGGLIEVTPTRVTIMVDDMEKAQEALNKADASKLDIDEAHKRLDEADARLKALNASNGIYYSK
jgi:F-type H+-transporting ATPase subunit epsilon